MRCHYGIFNTHNIRETIDSFACDPYVSSFLTDMCSLCFQKCGPRQNPSFCLIYFQRSGLYTHWFSHVCHILLLAYKGNRRIFTRKSEALLSWLTIRLLFWWFYLQSVWWLRKYYDVKIRLNEDLKFYYERLWPQCWKPNVMAALLKTKGIKKRSRNISQ